MFYNYTEALKGFQGLKRPWRDKLSFFNYKEVLKGCNYKEALKGYDYVL